MMIAEEQIKPGLEIVQHSYGLTRSARNGLIKTNYRIVDQRSEYSWNVVLLKHGEELRTYLSTGEIERCYVKQPE